jgi:four helix bundle protein
MFDFEKLFVYQKAKAARKATYDLLAKKNRLDRTTSDQLSRAIMAIILNIAEGTGKSSKADKRNFFTIARGSVYEVVAIIDILADDGILNKDDHEKLYSIYEEISKMLLGLIGSLR